MIRYFQDEAHYDRVSFLVMDFNMALPLSSVCRVAFIDIPRGPWEPGAVFIIAAVVSLLSHSVDE